MLVHSTIIILTSLKKSRRNGNGTSQETGTIDQEHREETSQLGWTHNENVSGQSIKQTTIKSRKTKRGKYGSGSEVNLLC